MRRPRVTLVLAALAAAAGPRAQAPGDVPARFAAVDVYVDSLGAGLAAYQVEVTCDAARSMLVGIEGGDAGPYAEPPRYDPAALHDLRGGRVVIAAFTTESGPPRGRVRVARLHFRESGEGAAAYGARLAAAGGPAGERIEAKVEVVPAGGPR